VLFSSIYDYRKVWGQTGTGMMPKIIEKNGRHALLVTGSFFYIGRTGA